MGPTKTAEKVISARAIQAHDDQSDMEALIADSCVLSDMFARGDKVGADPDLATYYAALCGRVILTPPHGIHEHFPMISRSMRASIRSENYLERLDQGLADYAAFAAAKYPDSPGAAAYITRSRQRAVALNKALVRRMPQRLSYFWLFVGLAATAGACAGFILAFDGEFEGHS